MVEGGDSCENAEEALMEKQANQDQLTVKALTKHFGGLAAINNVTFEVHPGEILGIIGPNGAGKTTLLNLITGVLSPDAGTISFNGRKINGLSIVRINGLGISRSFQDVRLFTNLSVLENVYAGVNQKEPATLIETMTGIGRSKNQEIEMRERAKQKLAVVGLESEAEQHPLSLTAKEQKLLAIARCLATEPKLLFLDEPAAGLSSGEIEELSAFLIGLRESGITIAFVEHRMELVMRISDRIIVLNFGKIIADDIPKRIQKNQAVREAYLPEGEVNGRG